MVREGVRWRFVAATGLGIVAWALGSTALAQQPRGGFLSGRSKPATAPAAAAPAAKGAAAEEQPTPKIEVTRHLVSPNDPIAIINGETISRQQLADECVAFKGQEILDMMISRKLIEQAVRAKKLEITPAEIDAEIDRIAENVAHVSREKWLATLSKERKISPSQYARDVIWPSLALRKLATPLVQVTEQDMKDGLEAQFGERVRCRMILLNSMPIAKQVWEDVKKNPALFDKMAQEKSIDPETRALGGLLPEPIARHANPRNISDAIFKQLVDATDVDPKTAAAAKMKPKDGDISGIIQVTDATWAIFKREAILPARSYDPKDETLRANLREAILDGKTGEKIPEVFQEIMMNAAIENRLSGQVKLAGSPEMKLPTDPNVQRTEGQTPGAAAPQGDGVQRSPVPAGTVPAGLSAEDAKKAATLKK